MQLPVQPQPVQLEPEQLEPEQEQARTLQPRPEPQRVPMLRPARVIRQQVLMLR
jgi:hypothetical protein